MAKLPEILVKEFVRMTNDTSKKKSESFLYGTVDKINEDGTIDVIFDGATDSTPCSSSVSVAVGDRVVLMLKDRQAVITSNASHPSINVDSLHATDIEFSGKLTGATGTFTGTLEGATYKDGTNNFTMDIGSHSEGGSITPAFKIGGYLNGDPNNDYFEIEITLLPVISDLPQLQITGRVKDNPSATEEHSVGIQLSDTGVAFSGSFPGYGNSVSSSLNWGVHI